MKGFLLDTNEELEFELRLIHNYDKYSKELKQYEAGKLPLTYPDYEKVELLHKCLPIALKKKEYKLSTDKLLLNLKKIESTNGVRHKTNMKNY
jgi:hypothetical protein